MTKQEDTRRKARRDLLLILLILPFVVLCMFATGQAAIKLAPTWMLEVDMFSHLDPDADFAGLGNPGLLEPVNPDILTQPAWENFFLTPNASIPIPQVAESEPATPTPVPVRPTQPPVIDTPIIRVSPTATLGGPVVIPTVGSQRADLSITKSDSNNTYTPGTTISYTIVVTNNGPDGADGFNIEDNVPTEITGVTVNCAPLGSCGANLSTGNTIFFQNGSLNPNSRFTITVSGLVSSGAVGNLSNSAHVRIPSESLIDDNVFANNSATDTNTRFAISDLAVTKTDNSNTYTATGPITYTIAITNSGPSDAFGVRIVDNKPSQIASWDWVCTTELNASGCDEVIGSTSNFTDNGLNIQVGGRIEYTVTAYMPANANTNTASIANTASIFLPAGPNFIDPNLTNNSSTDTDIPYIDLQIAKSDSGATFVPSGTLSYTVTVTNNSTFDLTGITVSDPKPTQLTNWTWTCVTVNPTCDGVTNSNATFADTIDLTANSNQVYNVTANVSANPGTGDITNTATVGVPTGLVDAVPGNNSATETTPPYIDLQITKTDGVTTYTSGGNLTYTVTVTNQSAFDLTGITVTDNMPALISSWSWTCAPNAGPPTASCTPGPSNTNINDTAVNLPAGRSVIYTINATVSSTATGDLTNTATVTSGYIDAVPGNNTAQDTDSRLMEIVPGTGIPDGTVVGGPSSGNSLDFTLATPITIDGNTDYEIVFYEWERPGNIINLDQIIISISSDGITWYTVYYWGDNIVDTNASPPGSTSEPDNFEISTSLLYGVSPAKSGILIDADNHPFYPQPPNGTYPYIRVTAPTGDTDGGCDIDSIGVWP